MNANELTKTRIIGEYPRHVPEGWIIFNAPRPIYGDLDWKGPFFCGPFYTAVDPEGKDAEWMIRENVESKAVALDYISEGVAIEESLDYYRQNFPKVLGEIDTTDSKDRGMLISGWVIREKAKANG